MNEEELKSKLSSVGQKFFVKCFYCSFPRSRETVAQLKNPPHTTKECYTYKTTSILYFPLMPKQPKCRSLVANGQCSLFTGLESPPAQKARVRKLHKTKPSFKDQDASNLMVGNTPLKHILEQGDIKTPLILMDILNELDWSEFIRVYSPEGQKAYSPMRMVGLILYGMIEGKQSLRELETFAIKDSGAWYVCGALWPDHSVIGRFIQRHSELLSDDFFVSLTEKVLEKTGSGVSSVAGDGTTIQAAASSYKRIKKEALERYTEKLKKQQEQEPENQHLADKIALNEEAMEILEQRAEARRINGRDPETTEVNRMEPEAVIQKQKNSNKAEASYKPTILSNDKRIIVAQSVHPSNENSCVETLVKQAQEQGELQDMLFDPGFFNTTTLDILKEFNALIPKDKTLTEQDEQQDTSKYYPKSKFQYDKQTDTYTCPQGSILSFVGSYLDKQNQRQERKYTCKACASCPVRDKCTKSQRGRTIKRYEGEELKEAMLEKMSLEVNKELYKKEALG